MAMLLLQERIIIPQTEAMAMLDPHLDRLCECMDHGWSMWRGIVEREPAFASPLERRERANVVNAHIRDKAWNLFDEDPVVRPYDDDGLPRLVVGNKLAIRLKLVDADGRARNVPTERQRQIDTQRHIAGMEDWMVLVCGYHLNPLETEIEKIIVSYKHPYRLRSWSQIVRGEDEGGALSFVRPAPKPDLDAAAGDGQISATGT